MQSIFRFVQGIEARAARSALLALAALLLGVTSVSAQGTDASIVGTVRAADGLGVSAAIVVVRHVPTGFQSQQQSRANGEFLFPQLPLGGPYTVSVRRIGYRVQSREGFQLDQGDRVRVDFALTPTVTELDAVVVSGAAVTGARKERLGASTKIGSEEIQEIPTADRNFTDLVSLAPTASNGINLGGNRTTAVDVRVDGVQARSQLGGGEVGRGHVHSRPFRCDGGSSSAQARAAMVMDSLCASLLRHMIERVAAIEACAIERL